MALPYGDQPQRRPGRGSYIPPSQLKPSPAASLQDWENTLLSDFSEQAEASVAQIQMMLFSNPIVLHSALGCGLQDCTCLLTTCYYTGPFLVNLSYFCSRCLKVCCNQILHFRTKVLSYLLYQQCRNGLNAGHNVLIIFLHI